MRLIKPVLFVLSFLCAFPLLAQEAVATGSSAGTVLQNIERALARPGITGAERRRALLTLARIQEVSGNIEGAAQSWTDAAMAEGGALDDQALVRGGLCWAALGEWEKAGSAVKTVLLSGRDPQARLDARRLDAQIEAFRSGDGRRLIPLLEDNAFAEARPALYYSLWKLSGAENWKTLLINEYPASPEGRIAAGGEASKITAKTSAFWLLLPGRESVMFERGTLEQAPPAPAQKSTGRYLLQTGLFSGEVNARNQAARLKDRGFEAAVGSRDVNGSLYWTVTVPAGNDMNRTILALKDAGFESFPMQEGE